MHTLISKIISFLRNAFYTLSATSWIIVFYAIKTGWALPLMKNIFPIPSFILSWFTIFLIIVAIVLTSYFGLLFTRSTSFGPYNFNDCVNSEHADVIFLGTYFTYFFIGFSAKGFLQQLVPLWIISSFFIFFTQTRYFNISYRFLGFRHYFLTDSDGQKICLISKKDLELSEEKTFKGLKKVSKNTYIDWEKEI